MKRIKFDDYNVGDEIPGLKSDPIQHMDLVRYAGASGDFNPIHTDPVFAKQAGLDGTIAHGMYVMAWMGRHYTSWVSPAQVKTFKVKFKGMTVPGEQIVCTGKVKRKKETDEGEKILTVSIQAANEKDEIKVAGDITVVCD